MKPAATTDEMTSLVKTHNREVALIAFFVLFSLAFSWFVLDRSLAVSESAQIVNDNAQQVLADYDALCRAHNALADWTKNLEDRLSRMENEMSYARIVASRYGINLFPTTRTEDEEDSDDTDDSDDNEGTNG